MKNSSSKTINLALQGGGAHGAFTWGVLDRLLEEEDLFVEGISGTSAGAMNALALTHGLLENGREGAKKTMADLWEALSQKGIADPKLTIGENYPSVDLSPAFAIMRSVGWFLSPYQFNPLAFDPLRLIVDDLIDFERIRKESPLKLFIAATQVRTGKIRVFKTNELNADALLASSCLPTIHRAVQIDGEAYWDGGFAGNPAIYPLLYNCESTDVMVVLLSPLMKDAHPTTAEEIRIRSAELSFNAAFLREMRSIADAKNRFASSPDVEGVLEKRLMNTHIHMIEADNLMNDLSHNSRLDTSKAFLDMLFTEGRDHAENWIKQSFRKVGNDSSIDLMEVFG